jgi:hypothetical protein
LSIVSTPPTIIATIELAAPETVFLDLTLYKPDPLRLSESETPALTRLGLVMPIRGGRETAIKLAERFSAKWSGKSGIK